MEKVEAQNAIVHGQADLEKAANHIQERDADDGPNPPEAMLVTWDGEDDLQNPKNWSLTRKWVITILTSFGGLVCLMSSTMLAPALKNIAHDLDIAQDTANMTLSIFVLAFAFGPMVRISCKIKTYRSLANRRQ